MRCAVLTLACLGYAGHGRRLQATFRGWQGISDKEHLDSKSAKGHTNAADVRDTGHMREFVQTDRGSMKELAMLLQAYQANGSFIPAGLGASLAISKPVLATRRHVPTMNVETLERPAAAPVSEALLVFEQLRAAGLVPPLQEVVSLLQQMRTEGVTPNLDHFNTAISACAREGNWAQAIAVWEDMRNAGVTPDLYSFNSVISLCGQAGRGKEVLALLAEMPEAGVNPTAATMNTGILSLLASGKIDDGFRMLRMFEAAERVGKYPIHSSMPIYRMIGEGVTWAQQEQEEGQGQHELDKACVEAVVEGATACLKDGLPNYDVADFCTRTMLNDVHSMHARIEKLTRASADGDYLQLEAPDSLENPYYDQMRAIRTDDLPVLRNARDKQSHRSARYYFCSDEDEHYYWKDNVENLGGIYVGVAAEQNYLISAWTRPEMIFLMDLNPYISQLHKAYGVSFGLAKTPDEFLALWRDSKGVDRVLEGVVRKYGETKEAQDILNMINGHPAIGLGFIGLALENIKKRYVGLKIPCFLTNQDQYNFLRDMWRTGRVLPILGDLTGKKTLSDICALSHRENLPIRVFYMSNAMYHITVNMFDVPLELLERFRDNFMVMAFDEKSLLLHTIQTSANQPGGFKIKSKDLVRQAYICKILGKDSQIPGKREPGKAWVFQETKGKEFSVWLTQGKKRTEAEAKKKAEQEQAKKASKRR